MSKLQTRVDKLQAVLEASKLLNSSGNVEEILDFLVHKSLELIEGGDTGIIFIYNENSKLLEVKTFVALGSSIAKVKLMPGESMTGIAFSNKKTGFYKNEEEVRRTMMTMRPENITLLEGALKGSPVNTRIYGSICCPLMYKEDCIGVIVMDNMNNHAEMTKEDVSILEAISVQAAIAIINARSYKKELKSNKILEKYSKQLEEERNKYRYSANIHSKFTEMVLNGSNINDILLEVSSLIERDVFMVDLFYCINYCCFKYHADKETVDNLSTSYISCLSSIKAVEYFNHDLRLHFYFYPIIVNRKNLGWIGIVSDNNNYSEMDIIAIEKGASILALELLKMSELNNMEQSLKGDFLDNLIQNQNKEYLMKCAKNNKFRLNKNHQIIIFELKEKADSNNLKKGELEFKRLVKLYYDIINDVVNKAFPNSISLIKGNSNIISVIEETENNKKRVQALFDKIMGNRSSQYGAFRHDHSIVLRAGVSGIIQSIDDFKQAYNNTQQVIRILDSLEGEGNQYLFYDDLQIERLFLNNNRETLSQFLMKALGPLVDGQNQTRNLLDTLKIYIQSNSNWTYTKDYLHIHGNTLSYRLKRIMELLKVDINDYKERLRIQIALEIYDLLPLSDVPGYLEGIQRLGKK